MQHFGFDLDNTIVDYSISCVKYSELINIPTKKSIDELKTYLKSERYEPQTWTRAQSWLYGSGLEFARVGFDFIEFVKKLKSRGWAFSIFSHKTEYGPSEFGSIPFQKVMLNWMISHNLNYFFQPEKNLWFLNSVEDKVAKINEAGVTHYIDDLPKILSHPKLSPHIKLYLYSQKINFEFEYPSISRFMDINIE